jgi:uncharacterized protein (TIGR00730 family)
MRRLCVFCGASSGRDGRYVKAAGDLGRALAARGIEAVYGGASIGVMAAVADSVLAENGSVIGVIPRHLASPEAAHAGLTRQYVVDTMHERKALMSDLSDAFVALPGGAGTLDELFEVWTWAQLGLHDKPVGLLDVDGFFQPLLAFIDHMVAEGFLAPSHRDILLVDTDPERLVDRLASRRHSRR